MSSVDTLLAVLVQESFNHIFAKDVAGTPLGLVEARLVVVGGIAPHQVCEGPFMRNFLKSVNGLDVVDEVKRRAEATMDGEELLIDDSSYGKAVKDIRVPLPRLWVSELRLALNVKSVYLSDLPCFVVAPKQAYSSGVSDLKEEE